MADEQKAVRIFTGRFVPPDRHPIVVVETLELDKRLSAQYFAFLRRDGSRPIVQLLTFDSDLVSLTQIFSPASDFVVEHARQRAQGELNLRAFAEFTGTEFTGTEGGGAVFEPVQLEEKDRKELAHFLLSANKQDAAAVLGEHCRSQELGDYLRTLSAVKATLRSPVGQ